MQHAPSITSYNYDENGNLTVSWSVDHFFTDPELPEDVSIEINNLSYKRNLGSDAREIEIPAKDLLRFNGGAINLTVVFEWFNEPSHFSARASVTIPLHSTSGGTSGGGLPTPVLRVVAIEPKILHKQNRITIGWSSDNYTHAKVIWGAIGGSKRQVESEPGRRGREVDYTGVFTTDVDLAPNTPYEFSVEVKNNMRSQSSTSVPTMVRSAANIRSLRQFLLASGIPQDQGIRIKTVMGGGISLRTVMGV